MSRNRVASIVISLLCAASAFSQNAGLHVKWEELTAPDFVRAVEESGKTCVLPFGILEKHGPQLPLGTDLLDSRVVSVRAAEREYAVVFPEYYFGQIFEARHQPGTVAYSERLQWDLLQETCDEIARNGFTKVLIVNGHGGNGSFLPYFCQSQLSRRRNYAVFLYRPASDPETSAQIRKMRKTTMEAHAGEMETSHMLAHRPDLVRLDQAATQSGADLNRLPSLIDLYTGIWWYAKFPNHYAGDAAPATKPLGEFSLTQRIDALAKAIKTVKTDTHTLELQKQFFDEAEQPLKTKQ